MEYVSRRPPRVRQAEALAKMRGMRVFALRMAQRCVDCETEYLSPTGWRRMDDYDGGLVAEFHLDGTAHFVKPIEYVKTPVDRFWHFKSQGAMDQVLSDQHRMLLCGRKNATWGKYVGDIPQDFRSREEIDTCAWREISALDFAETQPACKRHAPVSFLLRRNDTKINMTDAEIRLMIAFHADGYIGYEPHKPQTPRYGFVRVKRERKKIRLRELLTKANIAWKEHLVESTPDYITFKFIPPRLTKQYDSEWWLANDLQRQIIIDEVFNWDGRYKEDRKSWEYSSRHRSDVDFIQYCLASCGNRASVTGGYIRDDRPEHYSPIHKVTLTGDGRSNNLVIVPKPKIYTGNHDGFMYSFSVSSTYLVFRRNGKVFVSGNCGKSKVLLDDFGYLYSIGEAQDILIVAPGGAFRTWPTHVKTEFPEGLLEKTRIFLWESAKAKTKPFLQRLEDFLEYRDGPRVLVMNVEALSSVEGARILCMKYLKQRDSICAIDESVVIKNHESACGKFVAENLGPIAKYRRILTGLVAPRSPLDLFNQFRFLNIRILGHATFATFKARYAIVKKLCMLPDGQLRGMLRSAIDLGSATTPSVLQWRMLTVDPTLGKMPPSEMKQYLSNVCDWLPRDKVIDALGRFGRRIQTIEVIEGYKNVEELGPKLEPFSYRCKLEDCYDLPKSDYSIWEVTWHLEQKKIYDSLRKTCMAELETLDFVTERHVVTRMLRLHQILCGHVVDESGVLHDVPEKKTTALLSLLEDYDGKAVIWCSYKHSVAGVIKELSRVYGEESVSQFHGDNLKTREEDERRFKTDPRYRFIVATNAGRYGRDWAIADLVIYYSCLNNLDFRSQSEERCKADGKTRMVSYVDLIIPGTVEERFLWAIREKINMAAIIDNDNWREWVI